MCIILLKSANAFIWSHLCPSKWTRHCLLSWMCMSSGHISVHPSGQDIVYCPGCARHLVTSLSIQVDKTLSIVLDVHVIWSHLCPSKWTRHCLLSWMCMSSGHISVHPSGQDIVYCPGCACHLVTSLSIQVDKTLSIVLDVHVIWNRSHQRTIQLLCQLII